MRIASAEIVPIRQITIAHDKRPLHIRLRDWVYVEDCDLVPGYQDVIAAHFQEHLYMGYFCLLSEDPWTATLGGDNQIEVVPSRRPSSARKGPEITINGSTNTTEHRELRAHIHRLISPVEDWWGQFANGHEAIFIREFFASALKDISSDHADLLMQMREYVRLRRRAVYSNGDEDIASPPQKAF